MYEANNSEWSQAVQTSVHYLLNRINLDHAAVVGNVAAQDYVNYWAHETSDLEDNDSPSLVIFADYLIQVASKDDCVADHAGDWLDEGRVVEEKWDGQVH